MEVKVFYDDGHDYGEFNYFSKFHRINARGIKGEIESEILARFGVLRFKVIKILHFERVQKGRF